MRLRQVTFGLFNDKRHLKWWLSASRHLLLSSSRQTAAGMMTLVTDVAVRAFSISCLTASSVMVVCDIRHPQGSPTWGNPICWKKYYFSFPEVCKCILHFWLPLSLFPFMYIFHIHIVTLSCLQKFFLWARYLQTYMYVSFMK